MTTKWLIIVVINELEFPGSSPNNSFVPLMIEDIWTNKTKSVEIVIDVTFGLDWFAHSHC